jgi:hypothetical protein
MAEAAQVPELKSAAQLAADIKGDGEQKSTTADPRDAKEYSFELAWTDPRGHEWTGKFTNRILNIGDRRKAKVMKAQLGGNVSVEALDVDIWDLNGILAHLAFSLIRKPEWAKDLEKLEELGVVYEIWKEVDSHEARFHRRGPAAADSKRGDQDGAR